MGFLEETKVFLSTRYADSAGPGLSAATWRLQTGLETLNPLYKMKVKITGASIPNTFDRISEQLGNNKLAIVYSRVGETTVSVDDAVSDGRVIRVSVDRPFHEGQETRMMDYINDAIMEQASKLPLLQECNVRPYFVLDGESKRCALVAMDYTVVSVITPGDDGKSSALLEASVGDNTVVYKLVTQADLSADVALVESDVALAGVLGFTRLDSPAAMAGLSDPHGVVTSANNVQGGKFEGVEGVTRPQTAIDLSGVRFVTVSIPDLSITNISPTTLSTSRVLACLPVSSAFEGAASPIVSAVQDTPYVTVAQDRITKLTIELGDDRGRPLYMHHDWFLELSVRIEEPDKSDAYRGTEDLVMPAGAYALDPDPGRYAQLYNELKRGYAMLGQAESSERVEHVSRTRRR